MHRLSRASASSRSATKFIKLGRKNTRNDQGNKHNLTSYFVKTTPFFDSLNPRMFTPNTSCRGGLMSRMFIRHSATFQLHPEKLKQIMKERDGQHLCNYYDSDSYKKKAVHVVEEQNRVISEGTPQNLKETDVIYEHMLSCAQPRQKPKLIVIRRKKSEEEEKGTLSKVMTKISSKWKKQVKETGLPVNEPQIVYAPDSSGKKEGMAIKDFRRKYRKRSTILPLYLKKIQDNIAMREKLLAQGPNSAKNSAQKFTNQEYVNYETQMLNSRKPVYITKSEYKGETENKSEDNQDLPTENSFNMDYEEEVLKMGRFKGKSKYATGNEQSRHWYQNPNAIKKMDIDKENENVYPKIG